METTNSSTSSSSSDDSESSSDESVTMTTTTVPVNDNLYKVLLYYGKIIMNMRRILETNITNRNLNLHIIKVVIKPEIVGLLTNARNQLCNKLNTDWSLNELMYSPNVNTFFAIYVNVTNKSAGSYTNVVRLDTRLGGGNSSSRTNVKYGKTLAQLNALQSTENYVLRYFGNVRRSTKGLLVHRRTKEKNNKNK
jgi:hypothetical protein